MYKKDREKKSGSVQIDRESFEKLYHLYAKNMYHLAYHYVDSEAGNIVHDVFLSLWEKRGTIVIENPERYLNRAVKLKIMNYFRNNSSRAGHIEHIAATADRADRSTERIFNFKILVNEIDELITQLPARCQQVYAMHQRGMDKQEIAKKLNISESAVKQHITKALSHLRHNLQY